MGGEIIGRPDLDLTGVANTAFCLIAAARKTLKKNNYNDHYIKQFTNDAEAGDHEHLIAVLEKYFNVTGLEGGTPF